jgi:hypothetical protein
LLVIATWLVVIIIIVGQCFMTHQPWPTSINRAQQVRSRTGHGCANVRASATVAALLLIKRIGN